MELLPSITKSHKYNKDSQNRELSFSSFSSELSKEKIYKCLDDNNQDFSKYLHSVFEAQTGHEFNEGLQCKQIADIKFLNKLLYGNDIEKNREDFYNLYQKNLSEISKLLPQIELEIQKNSKAIIQKIDAVNKPYIIQKEMIDKQIAISHENLLQGLNISEDVRTITKKYLLQEVLLQKTKNYLHEIYQINVIDRDELLPFEMNKIKNISRSLYYDESSMISYCLEGLQKIVSTPKIVSDPFGGNHVFRRQMRIILEHDFSNIVFFDFQNNNKFSLDDFLNSDNRIKGNIAANLPREMQYYLQLDQTVKNQTEYQKYLTQLSTAIDNTLLFYELDIVKEEIGKFFHSDSKQEKLSTIDNAIRYLTTTSQIKKFSQNKIIKLNAIIKSINKKCEIKEGAISNIDFRNPLINDEVRGNIEQIDFLQLEKNLHELNTSIDDFIKKIKDPSVETLGYEIPTHKAEDFQVEQKNYTKFIQNINQKFSADVLTDKKIKYILLYDYILMKFVKFLHEQQNQSLSTFAATKTDDSNNDFDKIAA